MQVLNLTLMVFELAKMVIFTLRREREILFDQDISAMIN